MACSQWLLAQNYIPAKAKAPPHEGDIEFHNVFRHLHGLLETYI